MHVKRIFTLLSMLILLAGPEPGFPQTTPVDGLREKIPSTVALVNATIVVSPGKTIENGTLLLEEGRIVAVGKSVDIPPRAYRMDMAGQFIYPGFIDPYSAYGFAAAAKNGAGRPNGNETAAKESAAGMTHWNPFVHAARSAAETISPVPDQEAVYRSQGITVLQSAAADGIFRGKSVVFSLDNQPFNLRILLKDQNQFISFEQSRGDRVYPNSLMGSIALIRQALYDARWYGEAWKAFRLNPNQDQPESNDDLAALGAVLSGQQKPVFETGEGQSIFRAAKIAGEFGLQACYLGNGDEYRYIPALKTLKSTLIIPLAFPETPDVSSFDKENDVSLEDMKYWDTAPENPGRLSAAAIPFALTAHGLKDPAKYLENIRTAVKRGLSPDAALAALTTVPAKICAIDQLTGTLAAGKNANLVISDKAVFEKDAQIRYTVVNGEFFPVNPAPDVDVQGEWQLTLQQDNQPGMQKKLVISQKENKWSAKIDDTDLQQIDIAGNKIDLRFDGKLIGVDNPVRLSGRLTADKISGFGKIDPLTTVTWQAVKSGPVSVAPDTAKAEVVENALFAPVYPDKAYGREKLPDMPKVLAVVNVTLWTAADQGIIENADILIENGKISKIGTNLAIPKGALVIDGKGRHVTPGIIDAHAHIATAGSVNESTEAVTAEVRIEDVVDAEASILYRQLAGGVTTALALHGSANPIGGQSQTIKLRWGMPADDLKFKNAMPIIKFAMGENVKQSNWDVVGKRYPKSRMGVKEIMWDAFEAAKEYEAQWQAWESLSSSKKKTTIPPRKDLELDALVEVLHSRMNVHCHAYVQSEILMMMRVAEDFGFKIGTFVHVLEGYKVAPELKAHGAMATTFSDWWAYKFEVWDAIPYNGTMMHNQGVVTSFNSDNFELARRLNLEAAKAVKYGGISKEDAIKLVTRNAAIQLGIDTYVGSLETGKDADFVIWDGDPLSVYAKVDQTWIDGRKYFDRDEDAQLQESVQKQRADLIRKILTTAKAGNGGDNKRGK